MGFATFSPSYRFTAALHRLGDIDDEAEAEGGEGGFDLFHLRRMPQVEDAGDLRQMPAQAARQLGSATPCSRIAS